MSMQYTIQYTHKTYAARDKYASRFGLCTNPATHAQVLLPLAIVACLFFLLGSQTYAEEGMHVKERRDMPMICFLCVSLYRRANLPQADQCHDLGVTSGMVF